MNRVSDTRQLEYTTLTAACGHEIQVRLERDPVVAADTIATFMGHGCGRSDCPMTVRRPSLRNIWWSDVNRSRRP